MNGEGVGQLGIQDKNPKECRFMLKENNLYYCKRSYGFI